MTRNEKYRSCANDDREKKKKDTSFTDYLIIVRSSSKTLSSEWDSNQKFREDYDLTVTWRFSYLITFKTDT